MANVFSYSSDIAQKNYEYKQTSKGASLKIGNDYCFAKYVEDKIINERYSPDAVIGEIKEKELYFETCICTRTLYNYIKRGLFLNLSEKNLLYGEKLKRNTERVKKRVKLPLARSIDERGQHVNDREEFGHWEMDTVIGKKGTSECLLVLTERKTRHEIIRKIKSRTQEHVINEIDKIEKECECFNKVFKSITCDNGSEFVNYEAIERSCENGNRTIIFFCHPYSSYERGSNENANSIIRRMIPRGMDIGKYSDEQIRQIEAWINQYPRKILGYKSSSELFKKEVGKII